MIHLTHFELTECFSGCLNNTLVTVLIFKKSVITVKNILAYGTRISASTSGAGKFHLTSP